MATRAKKKATTAIPTLRDLEKQATRLRKDLGKTVDRVSREAARYIPKKNRRQFNDLLEKVNDLGESVSKRVTKTVKNVRADVEDTVFDLRGTVDKRVKALRKDVTTSSEKALESFEKEARKRVETVLHAIGIPTRSDIDRIGRRVHALERQVEQIVEGAIRKRAKAEEHEAA